MDDAYKAAVAVADKDWFKLNSSRDQLQLLKDLGFRPEEVQCGLEVVERNLSESTLPKSPGRHDRCFYLAVI